MDKNKIGVIKEPIIFWKGMTMEDKHEWGHVGMVVNIHAIGEHHYNISDPSAELEPMFAIKKSIQEISIDWEVIR